FQHMRYRNVKSIFGIHIGLWKVMRRFDYIYDFIATEQKAISVTSATTVMSDEIYLINVFYQGNNYVTFYKSYKKDDAFEKAKHFRSVLNIPILNATETQSIWVEAN